MSNRLISLVFVMVLALGVGTLAAASAPNWNLAGTWALDFSLGAGHYLHTMDISSFDATTGAFSGTGYYNPSPAAYQWTVTGAESGSAVDFHIVYSTYPGAANPGYYVDAVGTVSADGTSMSGTWTSSMGQAGTWTATGSATCVNNPTDVPMLCGAQQVLNLNYKVVNDEDSGFKGYWALDNYNKHVQVWKMATGSYYASVQYEGKFQTFKGALSPQAGTPETKDAQGTMHGGYTATFDATGSNQPQPAFIGTKDLGGTKADVLLGTYGAGQNGNPNSFSYLGAYFPGNSNFNYIHWGWTYQYKNQVWTNADSGSSGDIVS